MGLSRRGRPLSIAGLQAEVEARPVGAAECQHGAADGRRHHPVAGPETERRHGAAAAEQRPQPAGRLQREEAAQREPTQGAQAGEFGSLELRYLVASTFQPLAPPPGLSLLPSPHYLLLFFPHLTPLLLPPLTPLFPCPPPHVQEKER